MTRLTMGLVAFLYFFSSAHGIITPPKAPPLPKLAKKVSVEPLKEAQTPEPQGELLITDKTVIELDGRPCKYENVPPDAEIVLLEVAPDRKAILKIHFRSKK